MNSIQTVDTPAKTQKLTKLERRWYQEYLKDFNSSDALRRAYPNNTYAYDSIRTIAAQTKKAVFAKLSIDDDSLLDMMGLTETALINKGKEGLEATKPIFVNGKPQAVADYQTRHKYWQDFMKMKKMLSDSVKVEGDIKKDITITFVDDTKLKSIHSLDGEVVE